MKVNNMTEDDEILVDSATQPLEFALLALDLIHDQELVLNEHLELNAEVLEGGFALQYTLGNVLYFHLDHDEKLQCFIASVGSLSPSTNPEQWRVALSMNHLMPQERRFTIDAQTESLVLKETWKAQNLDLAMFASDVRSLINAMQMFLSSTEQLVEQEPVSDVNYLRV